MCEMYHKVLVYSFVSRASNSPWPPLGLLNARAGGSTRIKVPEGTMLDVQPQGFFLNKKIDSHGNNSYVYCLLRFEKD